MEYSIDAVAGAPVFIPRGDLEENDEYEKTLWSMAGSNGRSRCDGLWAGIEPNAGGTDPKLWKREWRLSRQFQYVLRSVCDGVAIDREPDWLYVHDDDPGPRPGKPGQS